MENKYIVKLEWTEGSPMILVKDAKSDGNKSIPYAFKTYDYKYSVAYFQTKEEASAAVEEAGKYYSYDGIPVILEVL
ncbi:MAG: hypothetical protein H6Q13_3158 [Bacteroidetes bacterium]|nr:hypothetical protein [Bacteroidota bacterium]